MNSCDTEIKAKGIFPWLSQELVIFIERQHDETLNEIIQRRYDDIQKLYQSQGLQFLYLPRITDVLGQKASLYLGGFHYTGSPIEAFSRILPDNVLDQLQNPSLVHYDCSKQAFHITAFDPITDEQSLYQFFESHAETFSLKPCAPLPGHAPQVRFHFEPIECGHLEEPSCELASTGSSRTPLPEGVRASREEGGARFSLSTPKTDTSTVPPVIDLSKRNSCEERDLALLADTENASLLHQMAELWDKLEEKGISKQLVMRLMKSAQEPIGIGIHWDYIYLLDSARRKLKLAPMERAFYILYLLHPEGISFKEMVDHKSELLKIYRALGPRGNRQTQEETVSRYVDPTRNLMSIGASRIKHAYTALLSEDLVEQYFISGPTGERKHIPLDRALVHWTDETLRQALGLRNEAGEREVSTFQRIAKTIFGKK